MMRRNLGPLFEFELQLPLLLVSTIEIGSSTHDGKQNGDSKEVSGHRAQ
jgi:hypothetical protein